MYPKHITANIRTALADTPVVLVNGARKYAGAITYYTGLQGNLSYHGWQRHFSRTHRGFVVIKNHWGLWPF